MERKLCHTQPTDKYGNFEQYGNLERVLGPKPHQHRRCVGALLRRTSRSLATLNSLAKFAEKEASAHPPEAAQVEVFINDHFGKSVQAKEWFHVPLPVIDEVAARTKVRTITDYVYDAKAARTD